jgi:hypothetical protein
MPKNSMLDNDFIDESDIEEANRDDFEDSSFEVDFSDDDKPAKAKAADEDKPKAKKPKEADDLEVEVVDDTPEKDRGKWVADDDPETDFANEEEIAQYSQDVQKRIKRYTARSHAERRRADEYERQLAEAKRMMASLVERNNRLSDLVENGEVALVGEHKGRIESQLDAAKRLYREAHDAGDPDGMAVAQEQIAKAAAALDRISMHRPVKLERADPRIYQQPAQPQQPRISEETAEWQERNKSWFGKDTAMTAYAMGVHANLVRNEGIRAESPEYWSRLDREIRARFPERFKGQAQNGQRRGNVVAPATRTSGVTGNKVTLTETQVKLARRLGLTTEQYAMQVLKEQRQREPNRRA